MFTFSSPQAGTPYAGGQFRVRLTLPKDFPTNPPKAYFLTKIFHPNVASNGEICVNTLKKDWKSDLGIKHVLLVSFVVTFSSSTLTVNPFQTIKCLLIVPNPESALNEEAGKLLLEDYETYSQRAKLMTDIHARPSCSSKAEHSDDDGCSSSKKLASEKKVQDKKKEKLIKEKRKILKRL
jgi:ubiquitin-conjugating enzyme E2 S